MAAGACTRTIDISAALVPNDGSQLAFVAHADGAQIYECQVQETDDVYNYQWRFVAPDAKLYDDAGHVIGHHCAGPTWRAEDGGKSVGTVIKRVAAPREDAIPWLLLSASNDGLHGAFSAITAVPRVNAIGGTTPRVPCTRERLQSRIRVRYTTDYRLFTPAASSVARTAKLR